MLIYWHLKSRATNVSGGSGGTWYGLVLMVAFGPAALVLTEQPLRAPGFLHCGLYCLKALQNAYLIFDKGGKNILSGEKAHLTNGAKKTGFLICRK